MLMILGNQVVRSRGDVARPTLVTGVAPFRSPLRVRVERKHDLANMIGKMASVRERAAVGRYGVEDGSRGRVEKSQDESIGNCRKSSVPKWADADWLQSRAVQAPIELMTIRGTYLSSTQLEASYPTPVVPFREKPYLFFSARCRSYQQLLQPLPVAPPPPNIASIHNRSHSRFWFCSDPSNEEPYQRLRLDYLVNQLICYSS